MQASEEERDDPYLILHLSPDASRQDLKDRYHQLTRTFHPDRQPAELYDHAKDFFKRTDEAYKAVSTPFNKFIYDNLGYDGLDLYDKNQAKFLDVEKHFIDQLHVEENVDQQQQNIADHEDKKQAILERFWHIARLLREEQDHLRVYNRVYLTTEFNCKNLIKQAIPFTHDKVVLSKVVIAPYIGLPTFKGLSSTVGFYVQGQKLPYAKGSERSLISLQNAYTFKSQNWILKDLGIRTQYHYQAQGNEFRLEFDKPISNKMSVTAKGQYYQGTFFPSLTVNRSINERNNISGELQFYSNQVGGNITHTTMVGNNVKLENDLNFSAGSLSFEQGYTYMINKRFNLVGGFTTNVSQQKKNELLISADAYFGFGLNFNKSTHMQLKGHIGFGTNMIDITITRHKHGWTIPLNFFKTPSLKSSAIILGITGLGCYFGYKYSKRRQNLHIKKLKREKMSKDALMEERIKLNTIQNDLKQHIIPLILEEIIKPNGLVLVRGYIGHRDQIYELRKFHRKINKLEKYKTEAQRRENIRNLLQKQDQATWPIDVEDFANQVHDITLLLIASMYMSVLKVDFQDYKTIKGLYNPCLDHVKDQPIIYFQYIQNGKVQDQIVELGEVKTIGGNKTFGFSLNRFLLNLV